MKYYKIYEYCFYNESIGEDNTYRQVLTKSYGDMKYFPTNNNFQLNVTIDKILKCCWYKEDVDIFVKENPECKGIDFTIWKENRNFGEKNWETYCPLQTIRDNIINELL